jgi:GNAT superfamily N-acetyltransferase
MTLLIERIACSQSVTKSWRKVILIHYERDMIPEQFSTERLVVHHWGTVVRDKQRRKNLVSALYGILTSSVLEHLPPALQLDDAAGGVSSWIDARVAESDVFLVNHKQGKELVGLMILACDPDADELPTIHIGYLIAEIAWGQGIASELLAGLVSAMASRRQVRLIGGVYKGNPASARVLEKAGFVLDSNLSEPEIDMFVLVLD